MYNKSNMICKIGEWEPLETLKNNNSMKIFLVVDKNICTY